MVNVNCASQHSENVAHFRAQQQTSKQIHRHEIYQRNREKRVLYARAYYKKHRHQLKLKRLLKKYGMQASADFGFVEVSDTETEGEIDVDQNSPA